MDPQTDAARSVTDGHATAAHSATARRRALRFVVFIGVVSLLADMTYEGARSITGPYLLVLGASAGVVGFVAGLGELVGYALRVVSGRAADRTGRYWAIAMGGYVVQMTAVPLLAVAGQWQVAALLIVAERTGKAVRNPAKNVLLSHAAEDIGQGFAFGLHEGIDQTGALVGPLMAAAVLYGQGEYRPAFAILAVPAVLTLVGFATAWRTYPDLGTRLTPTTAGGPEAGSAVGAEAGSAAGAFDRSFWVYLGAAALVGAGFADFTLMAYHFQRAAVIGRAWTPVFYAIAMAVSGIGSLSFGRMFDRVGLVVLVPLTVVSAAFAPLVFYGSFGPALVGTALWGLGTGVHESVMAAAVALVVPLERRGSAYGLFNAAYGVSWFLGSWLMGFLYGAFRPGLVIFAMATQLAAVPLLAGLAGSGRYRPRAALSKRV